MIIDHIGYLSKDIGKSIQAFESLGYKQETEVITDNKAAEGFSARNVYICFLRNGYIRIELVSPIDENSDIYFTLKRQGEGPYHICYRVDDLEKAIQDLKRNAWMLLKRPAKATALDDARVAFLFKNGVGMIELVETKE